MNTAFHLENENWPMPTSEFPSVTNCWMLLVIAGLLETGWAIGLKSTDGFTRLWPSVWTGLALVASMILLAIAVRGIPIGTAYVVWVGIGAAGTVVLEILLFGQKVTWGKSFFFAMMLVAIFGLKWSSSQPGADAPKDQVAKAES